MRALLIVATLLAAVDAQEAAAPERPAQPSKAAPLDKSLTAVLAEIATTAHAFDGRLTWGPQRGANWPVEPLDIAFAGGVTADADGELRWHSQQQWTVLQRGERGATRFAGEADAAGGSAQTETGWQCPQGDAPEVPLSPRLLLEQLPHATLSRPAPTEVDGRPAMSVLATWHGEALKTVCQLPAVPSSRHEQLLDTLAKISSRSDLVTVCAEIRYDPATKRWLAATMRLLVVENRPLPTDEPPLPAPEGMPAPTGRPQIELIVTLRRRDPAELPPPELDERARELLRRR